ncbi:MAG: recombinase RecT [Pseudomonadota bacterium]
MQQLAEMKADQQADTNALAKVANHPILGKTSYLDKRKDLLGAGIPGHMTVEREIRTATIMLMQSPDLQKSSPQSFYVAVSIAVNSGIGLGNGKGYLIPYKGNVSYVPGWKGLVDLVSRTGRASVWTGVVHKGDHFEYALGDSPFLTHKPGDNEDHADITHYYAIGRVKGSEWPHIVVWSVAKVIKHLNKFNKVGGKHYALKDDNNMEMYSRKVVLLQVLKYLPQSQDLENAIAAENAHEAGKNATIDGNFVYIDDNDYGAPADAGDEEIPRTDHQGAETVEVREVKPEAKAEAKPEAKPAAAKTVLTPEMAAAYEKLAGQLNAAPNLDKLADAADLIGTIGEQELRAALSGIYRTRYADLTSEPVPVKAEPEPTAAPGKRTRRAAPAPE